MLIIVTIYVIGLCIVFKKTEFGQNECLVTIILLIEVGFFVWDVLHNLLKIYLVKIDVHFML